MIVTIDFTHLRRSNEDEEEEEGTAKNSIACMNIYVDIVWNSTLCSCVCVFVYVFYMGAFDIDSKVLFLSPLTLLP